ncbi:hypothetical protein [Paraburkholderia sp. GAS348]|uniref:hypothetical protein n=1 Tax=Paraburkholderia sp. GAS348 TaxID=3035132 RepID=UPI003D23DAF7
MKKLILCPCVAGMAAAQYLSTAAAQDFAQPLTGWTSTTTEHVVGSCRFSIANMFDGHFEAFDGSSPVQGGYLLPMTGPKAFLTDGFGIFCVDASEERITSALNARYVAGKWLRHGPVNGPEFIQFEKQANARTVPMKRANWTRMAYTDDDTTGDERQRTRVFHFCLIHKAHALCGNTPVKWLADRKTRSDLDRIKAILEPVEFVDTPTPVDANAISGVTTFFDRQNNRDDENRTQGIPIQHQIFHESTFGRS